MSLFFNGQNYVSPTTVSKVEDSALANVGTRTGNTLVILGSSLGGKPNTPIAFSSPPEARALLRGGELLTAVERAFAPSAETGGPSRVVAMRVDPATRSTLILRDAAAANAIVLTSQDYGLDSNRIKVRVETGTLSGRRLTVTQDRATYSRDNVGRRAFSIRYSGSEASATMSINGTTVTLSSPAGNAVATIDLASYRTISALVDRISATTGFTAAVLDSNGDRATVNGLDFYNAVDVRTADFIARADLQAAVDWFNSAAEGLVDAARASGAGQPPAPLAATFLAGAVAGTITNNEWAAAFETLQGANVQWVVPLSSAPSIHAMADAHAQFMSGPGRKERRVLCGGALGETRDQAVAAAGLIGSDRTSYCYPGYLDFNAAGDLSLYAPYMLAALIGGMAAGVSPGTPLTNKAITVRGLEVDLRNPTDTDVLITGGVLCVENVDGVFKVVQSISTWQVNDNFNRVEISTGAALDFLSKEIRAALDVLRGTRGSPQTLARAKQITDSKLRDLAVAEPNGPGVIVGDEANPAYKNIVVSLSGDVISVQFQASPVIPANYIAITIYAVPYSATISG